MHCIKREDVQPEIKMHFIQMSKLTINNNMSNGHSKSILESENDRHLALQ